MRSKWLLTLLGLSMLAAGTRTPPRTGAFVTGSFDTSATTLGRGFRGHDIAAVYNALRRVDAPRGDLETTVSYQARLREPLADDRILAFVGEIPSFTKMGSIGTPENYDNTGKRQVDLTYDPDRGEVTLWVNHTVVDKPGGGALDLLPAVLVRKATLSRRTRVMQNSFGAAVKVTDSRYHEHLLCLTNSTLEDPASLGRLATFPVSMELAAQIHRDADRSLLVCHADRFPDVPVAFQGLTGKGEATLDSPYTFVAQEDCVSVRIDAVWLFSSKTGQVVAKLALSPEG